MTKDQKIEYFISRCNYYIELFGRKHYKFYFKEFDSKGKYEAYWVNNEEGKQITIKWDEKWINSVSLINDIDLNAFHEVRETMFSKIWDLMRKFYSDEFIQELVHEIIRTDENVIFPKIKDGEY